jgi:hypothetical protein
MLLLPTFLRLGYVKHAVLLAWILLRASDLIHRFLDAACLLVRRRHGGGELERERERCLDLACAKTHNVEKNSLIVLLVYCLCIAVSYCFVPDAV